MRFLYRRPTPPENVVFIFRMDAVAQEINETLRLELVRASISATLPTGDAVFFRSTINMTILDNDSKTERGLCSLLVNLMTDSFYHKIYSGGHILHGR